MLFRIDKKTSETVSLITALLFGVIVCVCAAVMPLLCRSLLAAKGEMTPGFTVSGAEYALILVLAYLLLLLMGIADYFTLRLLFRVRKGIVFTDATVICFRRISWCCVLASVLFAVLGIWFTISFGVAFMAFFVGLCLRVVKNVLEEANAIKDENDLTI